MAKQRLSATQTGFREQAGPLGLVVLTALSLLLLGANSPAATCFVVCCAGLLWLTSGLPRRREPAAVGLRLPLVPLLGLPLLALAQLAVVSAVRPWSGAPVLAIGEHALLLTACLLFFVCAMTAVRMRGGADIIVVGLFAIGAAEAAYGSLNFLAGNQTLLIFPRWAYFDSATGTLVNRNHFAYLLEMTIPLGFLVASTPAVAVDPQLRIRGHRTEDGARRTLLAMAVGVMLLALLLSRSRMGLASLAGAAALVMVLDRMLRPSGQDAGARVGTRAAVLVGVGSAVFLLLGVGFDVAFERFFRATSDLEIGRLPVWKNAWKMFLAHPLLGNGFGSFGYLDAAYRAEPTGFYPGHVHCDYLEVLCESGIAGLAIVASWVVLFFRRLARTLRCDLEPMRRSAVLATAVAVLSILLHSTVDFGLRTRGVALAYLLVVALFLGFTMDPPRYDDETPAKHR